MRFLVIDAGVDDLVGAHAAAEVLQRLLQRLFVDVGIYTLLTHVST
jgi:hypothetical protein